MKEMAMVKVGNFRDLIVWQRGMDLACEVYRLVKLLPKEETYALSDQMRRAVVSIPSNIAEGKSRNSSSEYSRFLGIARGSNAELETQIELCIRLGFIQAGQAENALSLISEIGRMLTTIMQKIALTPSP